MKYKFIYINQLFLIISLLFLFSCNFSVPSGKETLALFNNIRKIIAGYTSNIANIKVSGTLKDSMGNIIPGGTLDITKVNNYSMYEKVNLDTKVYSDISGKFTMNINTGNFTIRVSNSEGLFIGSFELKIKSTIDTPEINSSSGLQVTDLKAIPVNSESDNNSISGVPIINVSNLSSSLIEGSSGNLGISLSGNIIKNYTISISSSNPNSISVNPSSLTFDASNYSIAQQITVTALQDDNLLSEEVTISVTSSELKTVTFSILAVDDDIQNFLISGISSINEEESGVVSVRLSKQPNNLVSVSLSSSNSSSLQLDKNSLTFTTDNFSTPQVVNLSAIKDTNQSSEIITLSLVANGINTGTWDVLVYDNDTRIVFSGGSSLNEGGELSLGVSLSGNPGSNRTVNFTSSNIFSMSITPSGINFNSTNWNIPQTLILSGVQDSNSRSENVVLTASGVNLLSTTKSISVNDKDTQGIILLGSSSTVDEGSSGATIGVRLKYDPIDPFQIILTSSNPNSLSVNPATLTFSSSNYSNTQTVILTGVEDINESSELVTIQASGIGVESQSLTFTTIENDTTITFGLPTGYEGTPITVPITLSGNPGNSRTITISSNKNPSTHSPNTMTFTTSNFNIPQYLTLSSMTDSDNSIIITASDSNQNLATKLVSKSWNATNAKYTIGGTITGLTGNLVLTNKDSYDTITITNNGNFSFPKLASTYAISVKYYLLGKICSFTQLSDIALSTVNDIGITCSSKSYTLGEAASGLISTGQTTVYETGDDGTFQATLGRSFTDNKDGTIRDNISGLLYQKCGSGLSLDNNCSGTPGKLNYTDALNYCSSLNLAGISWRLPSLNELANLGDIGKSSPPKIDTNLFPKTEQFYYWTSTPVFIDEYSVWLVDFLSYNITTSSKSYDFYVRCVSGNSSTKTYTDNGNGTIKDNATGLIWQKCSFGQDPLNCSGDGSTINWSFSLSYCKNLSLGGRSDWKLPNINQLRSIVDYSTRSPSINFSYFPYTERYVYWSSSTSTNNTNYSYYVNFYDGYIYSNDKSSIGYVRCVTGP